MDGVGLSRLTMNLDRFMLLSESSLLGWFLEVSLIVIIEGRSQVQVSLIVIIKLFHNFSPNFSHSADDSPDQTVDRIKV